MVIESEPVTAASFPQTEQTPMRVSRYERFSSLLIALLILVGIATTILFVAWLMQSRLIIVDPLKPVPTEESPGGSQGVQHPLELEEPANTEIEMPEVTDISQL